MVTEKIKSSSLFSLIVGPMVWMVHFLTLYLTTAIACAKGFFHLEVLGLGVISWVALIATLVASALILDGAIIAFRRWRGSAQKEETAPPPKENRNRYRALAAKLSLRERRPPREERTETPTPPHDQATMQSRRRFLAYAGLLLCGLALIATLWGALPVLFMTSCQ